MADKKPDPSSKPSAGDVQKRVGELVARVKAEPDNPGPLMELTQTYVQIFLKTKQDEVLSRVMQCLDRASKIEADSHLETLKQVVTVVQDEVQQQGLSARESELREIAARVAERSPAETEPEETPAAEETAETEAPEAEFSMDDIESMVGGSDASDFDPLASARDDMPFEMEVTSADEEESEEGTESDAEQTASGRPRQAVEREHQAANAQALAQVQELFEEEDINGILQLYSQVSETRIHRRILDRLTEKIGEWGIGPVLAAASLDTDEQVFRQLMRNLVKGDRVELCRSIDFENYSPDLQRVSVRVLSDILSPAALPKLEKALQNEDETIRVSAAEGIARLGHAAQRAIPRLLERVAEDDNAQVRQAAADALKRMDLKEAYQGLEALADSKHLDGLVYDILEDLREKYGVTTRRKTKKGMTAAQKEKMKKMVIGVVVAIVLVGLVLWQYVLKGGQ